MLVLMLDTSFLASGRWLTLHTKPIRTVLGVKQHSTAVFASVLGRWCCAFSTSPVGTFSVAGWPLAPFSPSSIYCVAQGGKEQWKRGSQSDLQRHKQGRGKRKIICCWTGWREEEVGLPLLNKHVIAKAHQQKGDPATKHLNPSIEVKASEATEHE